jgi:hypothetical protein
MTQTEIPSTAPACLDSYRVRHIRERRRDQGTLRRPVLRSPAQQSHQTVICFYVKPQSREREGYREQTGKSLSACSRLDLRNVERNERQVPIPASSAATKFHIRYKYRDVHMQQVASRNRKYYRRHTHRLFPITPLDQRETTLPS